MVRILRSTQFQLRLGWLSLMAVFLGDPDSGRADRDTLGKALLKIATRREGNEEIQSRWLVSAGLSAAPQGRISPRAEGEIARMGELYGIYDPESQTLTDLGYVLLAVERWRGENGGTSPFCWTGAKRFIGLRLLLGANGDLALSLLLRFPPSGELLRESALPLLASCVEDLLENATHDDERAEITRQIARLRSAALSDAKDAQEERYLRTQHIHPQLEPLRELGYLRSGERAGDYALTDTGFRLRAALSEGVKADALLRDGLSRLFLESEGVQTVGPAGGMDIRATLRELPEQLHASTTEAPLEPVVLLTQCRLITASPGRWLDLASGITLAEALERSTRGRVGLKHTTLVGRYNLAWTSPETLDEPSLWKVETMERPEEGITSMGGHPDLQAAPAFHEGLTVTGLKAGESSEEHEAQRSLLSTLNERKRQLTSEEHEARRSLLSTLNERKRQLTPPRGELHLKLWVKYLFELLDTPAPGGVAATSFGGPHAWTETLRHYLDHPMIDKKRSPSQELFPSGKPEEKILALAPLSTWLKSIGQLSSTEPVRRCVRLWASPQHATGTRLQGELLWASAALDTLAGELAMLVRDFVSTARDNVDLDAWLRAREATRALVEDAVHRGHWRRDELRGWLQENMGEVAAGRKNRIEVCHALLEHLTRVPDEEEFSYEQEFQVPRWFSQTLEQLSSDQRQLNFNSAQVELSSTMLAKEAETQAPSTVTIAATVNLRARTPLQAYSRGAEYAYDALSRLRFLALLRCAGSLPPSTDDRRIDPGTVRFSRGNGSSWGPRTAGEETPIELQRPELLGFVRVTSRPEECPVQALPGLASVDRGTFLDGRARLTRALHWLSVAEDKGERPGERLSHAWVALEHLVTDGGDSKLPVVLDSVPAAIALCHLRAMFGAVAREGLAALHLLACTRWEDPDIARQIEAWLGRKAGEWYASRPAIESRFMEERSIDDEHGLRELLTHRSDVEALIATLEPSAPFAACRHREVIELLTSRRALRDALQRMRADAACLLSQVYDVRNQLVHDANPFGFDETSRLHVLYDRYRVLIDPVVAAVLRLVVGRPEAPLSHAWSVLRARFEELSDSEGGTDSINERRLIACLVGI